MPTPPRDPDLTDPRSPVPRRFSDGEAVALTVPVSFHIGDDVQGKAGTLHITTRRLVWFGEGADSAGYEVPFTSLTMHAVSRGAEDGSNDFTSPFIYAQVEGTPPEGFGATIAIGGDGPATDADEGEEDDDEGDDEDDAGGFAMGGGDDGDYDDMFELRIVPKDPEGLDQMFHVLCECAAMNPDDDEDEEDDDGGLFFDEDEVMRGAGADGRAAALERFDAMLQIDPGVDELIRDDPGRFEDDEEEEEGK